MNPFKAYIAYIKDNPERLWFKRKLFGWGWTPATWEGWLVIAASIFIVIGGVYIGDVDDAPGVALFGILLAIALLIGFGYWKGEKPRWQWGFPKKEE